MDIRVGDVEAGQVVGSIAEEVKQSIARRRHDLRDRLISSCLWYNETTEGETEREQDRERYKAPL